MLSLTPAYGLYLTYIKGIASPRFEDLGFESQPGTPDDPTRIYLRSYVIGMMCGADDEKCLDAALKMFRRWSKNGTPISPDIRSEVGALASCCLPCSEFSYHFIKLIQFRG